MTFLPDKNNGKKCLIRWYWRSNTLYLWISMSRFILFDRLELQRPLTVHVKVHWSLFGTWVLAIFNLTLVINGWLFCALSVTLNDILWTDSNRISPRFQVVSADRSSWKGATALMLLDSFCGGFYFLHATELKLSHLIWPTARGRRYDVMGRLGVWHIPYSFMDVQGL